MEFESTYNYILEYPEFDLVKILKKYQYFNITNTLTGEGEQVTPEWIFRTDSAYNYVIHVYAPDSPMITIKDLRTRKLKALEKFIESKQWDAIMENRNPMIGDMITRVFREVNDFDYELMLSAKEAVETLMEVVRKPLDSNMTDDKERNAIKSKRECFDDAKYILAEIRKMQAAIEDKSVDVADHVNKSVFRTGMAERLALKGNK